MVPLYHSKLSWLQCARVSRQNSLALWCLALPVILRQNCMVCGVCGVCGVYVCVVCVVCVSVCVVCVVYVCVWCLCECVWCVWCLCECVVCVVYVIVCVCVCGWVVWVVYVSVCVCVVCVRVCFRGGGILPSFVVTFGFLAKLHQTRNKYYILFCSHR
jgi:hypothetical protein